MKKKATKKEREYMGKVKMLPCYVSNSQCSAGVQAHHKIGPGARASHYDTMPLCFNHHQQQSPLGFGHSVHNGTRTFEANYATQDEMIAHTKKAISELDFTTCSL